MSSDRVADGTAGGLGDGLSRTDQLRMLGNGVVPQCAALAFLTLLRRLTED
jgi:site-specific DNA-cytosine methylase